jgi:hypothetical protein
VIAADWFTKATGNFLVENDIMELVRRNYPVYVPEMFKDDFCDKGYYWSYLVRDYGRPGTSTTSITRRGINARDSIRKRKLPDRGRLKDDREFDQKNTVTNGCDDGILEDPMVEESNEEEGKEDEVEEEEEDFFVEKAVAALVSLEQDSIADDEVFYPGSGHGNCSVTSDDELVDDNFLLDAEREDELLKKFISSSQPRMVGDYPEDCPLVITPMVHLFWIVALNNVAGCQQFFLKGLVEMDGKIKAQPLRNRQLGNVLVRSPNPMSTRGLDITTMASVSLANGCALGVISMMANTDDGTTDHHLSHTSPRESDQGEMSLSYCRRCLGPGEPPMTPDDAIVIANVLMFRIYGAMKIWYEYVNCFEPTPLVPKKDETGLVGTPVFGLAGFSSEQLDRLDRFFQILTGKNNQNGTLGCLATVQHRVPGSVYATKNGALSFVKDVIGTFSKLISTISVDSKITCPRQFVDAIEKHFENHSKNTLWEVIAQWVYIDLTFLF